MKYSKKILDFWQKVIQETNIKGDFYDAWGFGSTPEVMDELLGLVLEGKKRTTTTLIKGMEIEDYPPPKARARNRRGYDLAISIELDDSWSTRTSNEFERNFDGETHRVKYDPDDVNSTIHMTNVDNILREYPDSLVAVFAFSFRELIHLINQSAKYARAPTSSLQASLKSRCFS